MHSDQAQHQNIRQVIREESKGEMAVPGLGEPQPKSDENKSSDSVKSSLKAMPSVVESQGQQSKASDEP